MNMSQPTISILTPTYNRSKNFLLQTIQCIQNQEEIGFTHEHIIVDNDSDDETKEVVAHFTKKDKRIKYIKSKVNHGPAAALNMALKRAKGEYIFPLDDDDLLAPHSLQVFIDFMRANKKIDWAFSYSMNIDQNNSLIKMSDRIPNFIKDKNKFFLDLLKDNTINNGAVIIKKSCAEKVGGWDENVKSQDWDMWLKLAHAKFNHALLKNYLGFYRVHKNQLTTKHEKDGTWDIDQKYFMTKYKVTKL
jgi:glycosyltransferase involved in cell wall biosynthesis